ncbi:hypothetical protein FOZ63_020199, partial [Perkinsus olseni]
MLQALSGGRESGVFVRPRGYQSVVMRSNFESDKRPRKIRKTVKWRPGTRRPGDDSLESCLANRGLLWLEGVAFEKASRLPLEIFDDASFWMRTPHEWNEFIRTMGGRPLAGRYLF